MNNQRNKSKVQQKNSLNVRSCVFICSLVNETKQENKYENNNTI